MTKKIKLIVIIFFLLFIVNVSSSWAISEDRVESSAEDLVGKWEKLISKEPSLLYYYDDMGAWSVTKIHLVSGSLGFDIRRTNSIVTPYRLIIYLKTNFSGNDGSPNANFVKSNGNKFGFKTAKDALNNTKPIDLSMDSFKGIPFEYDLAIYYAFQKNFWVFKNGNDDFNFYIGQRMLMKENIYLFKGLFKIPVK